MSIDRSKKAVLFTFEYISENIEIFRSLDNIEQKIENVKQKTKGMSCGSCGSEPIKKAFAMEIAGELIKKDNQDIFKQMPQYSIMRYGNKLYWIKDLIK